MKLKKEVLAPTKATKATHSSVLVISAVLALVGVWVGSTSYATVLVSDTLGSFYAWVWAMVVIPFTAYLAFFHPGTESLLKRLIFRRSVQSDL